MGFGNFRFRPAREAATEQVVADLDSLIVKPTPFRFNGKIHHIKPISTEVFFSIVNEIAHMETLRKKDDITAEELIDGYTRLIGSACDTIKRHDIENMTQAQVGALLQLVLDVVSANTEKKNLN